MEIKFESVVRGGGIGNRFWVAKITGRDAKFGLARQFLKKDLSDLSGSGRSGTIEVTITEPGFYEFRERMTSDRSISDRAYGGFLQVDEAGNVVEVEREFVEGEIN